MMTNFATFNCLALLLVTFVASLPLEIGIHPDSENCKNYYLCGYYQSCESYTCGADLLFDTEILVCNYPDVVDCGDRPKPHAPTLEIVVQPDPENCKNYYLCDHQGCHLYACEADLLFDAEILVCNYPSVVDCGDRPSPYAPSTVNPSHSTTTTNKIVSSSTL